MVDDCLTSLKKYVCEFNLSKERIRFFIFLVGTGAHPTWLT
jgi:hypothetical protein